METTESQMQQPEYADTTSPDVMLASEPAPLAKLSAAAPSEDQWQRIGTQVSNFLAQLPDYVGQFYNTYKQPLITIVLILAAIVSVRVVLAVLDALNGIPLLGPTFELVGIGYSAWFVNRYLLKASTRQELSQELEGLKSQVVGSQQLPESQS